MPENLGIQGISRDKCMDTWTRAGDTDECRNLGNFGDFLEVRILWFSRLLDREFADLTPVSRFKRNFHRKTPLPGTARAARGAKFSVEIQISYLVATNACILRPDMFYLIAINAWDLG